MPFDCLTPRVDDHTEPLSAALAAAGISAAGIDILERHKAAEVLRHPPGWIYRHRLAIQLGQLCLLVAGLAGFMLLSAADFIDWGMAAVLAAAALAFAPMLVPARGPAEWSESWAPDLVAVPEVIRGPALQLKRKLPGLWLYVGELHQNRFTLDPYLVADFRGSRFLLGIWDGDRILYSAFGFPASAAAE